MDEKTPLLHKEKKHKRKIIDNGIIICKDDNEIETIEIIVKNYNVNYYFDITSTNCLKLLKLCTTIHGMLVIIHKEDTNEQCIISWKAFIYK